MDEAVRIPGVVATFKLASRPWDCYLDSVTLNFLVLTFLVLVKFCYCRMSRALVGRACGLADTVQSRVHNRSVVFYRLYSTP